MGLTKEYVRYVPTNVFGVIGNPRSNLKLIKFRGQAGGKFAAAGACEYVFVWDLKKNECVLKLGGGPEKPSEVMCIEQDARNPHRLAVGYLDGSLRLFDLRQKPDVVDDYSSQLSIDSQSISSYLTFNGHKASVTSIAFDHDGVRMVSGAKDTEIVVWDLIGECGLFRLKGHKAPITKAIFVPRRNILISSAKDMLVKFWDLDTRHCFKTLVNHRTEVNDLMLAHDGNRLLTGCHDNELRVFELIFNSDVPDDEQQDLTRTKTKSSKLQKLANTEMGAETEASGGNQDEETSSLSALVECNLLGSIVRESKDPLGQLCLDNTATVMASLSGAEKHVEIYKINSDDEIRKKLAKRLKKQKRKLAGDTTAAAAENDQNGEIDDSRGHFLAAAFSDGILTPFWVDKDALEIEKTVSDEFTRICQVKSKHRIKRVDLYTELTASRTTRTSKQASGDDIIGECKVACQLQNNQIEVYLVRLSRQLNNIETPELVLTLDAAGHRTDVRTLCFSSDSTAFVSASGDSLKVWNRMGLTPIRTFSCDYALSSLFMSDDNHVLIGTNATMLENVIAHDDEKSVWSMCLVPDKSGFVSGSADKTVRFWNFELVDDEESKARKRLTFGHSRTLKLDDDVLSVKISPNNRLIAVALLDTTVKVFFMDSLKLFLNLYGHKQPVLSMDISADSRLIVTGSADRHVKLWGLDFGDCHRSIFAHEDSVQSVQFVGKTHYFFSVGRDGKLKEWDGDKFERIITLEGHLYEIWALAVSPDGKYVITASHDKSMRLWQKTQEPLVLEDERETEKEKQYESEIPKEEQVIPGETSQETGLATIKTIETIKSAEKLIESLNIFNEETIKKKEFQEAKDRCSTQEEKDRIKLDPKHPLLVALGDLAEEDYVLDTLKKTKSSEIETTLLVLEFEHVKMLLELLAGFLATNREVELCLRCAIFLLKINFGQITTTQTLLPLIERLKNLCSTRLSSYQDTVGFNLAATKFIKNKLEEDDEVRLFSDLTLKSKDKKKTKQKQIALISLKSASSVV